MKQLTPINKQEYKVKEKDILSDIVYFLKEEYLAKIYEDENGVSINFSNGQNFRVFVNEKKN